MKSIKKKHILICTIVLILIIIGIFFEFTTFGYGMTVPLRGYTKIKDNIYIDKSFNDDRSKVVSIIDEAQNRLKKFWGTTKSNPTIIISSDERKLKKMGWTGTSALTTTRVFFGAHSYVLISPKGLDIDATAHELTHAELHYRLDKEKILKQPFIPVWFDEGVAMQNDYRERYNYDAWVKVTDDGKNVTDFSKIKDQGQFYGSNIDVRRYNYIISKHEVEEWLKTHSVEDLSGLINDLNKGGSFNELYYKK